MEKTRKKNNRVGSIRSIFMHADGVDLLYMVFGLIGAVGDGLTMPLMFVVTSKFMNDIGARDSFRSPDEFSRSVNKKVISICIIAAGAAIVNFLEGYCWTRTAERQTSRMRLSYLKAVLRQDVGFFEVQVASSFEVVNNVSSDSLTIQEVISEKVPHFVMNMSNFIGSYVTTYLVIWRLALVGMPFVLLLIIPGLMYGKISIGLARKVSIEYNKAGSIAEQAIGSIRTVYAFIGESKTMSKFSDILKGSMKLGLKQGLAKGIAVGSNGVTFMIWAFNAWYGSNLVMDYGAKGGTVYIMVLNLLVGGLALGSSLSDIKSFSEAASAGERIMEMIHRVPNIDTENMDDPTIEHVSGEIEFKHVKFAYPTRPNSIIFQDFSLHIPAKKTVALVGQSGSGKSTSIALLQRFYDPIAGEILLDGVAIHKLQLKWLRSHMALVSQEPALFATSIKENILFGKEEATMEEVIQTAKASNAHNFITRLPQGYDTQVGERGVQMSGGQKQRIAIARAIIRKACILLLDEATSALDSESERVVQEALDNAIVGRTTITIAHRLSTIRNADIIAVVENGQVMELGSNDDLIRHENGIYTSLLNLQQINQTQDHAMSLSNISTPTSSIFEEIIISSCNSSRRTTPLVSEESSLLKELPSEVTGEDKVPVPSFRRLLALSKPEWKQASLGCVGAILFGAIQPVCALVLAMTLSAYFLQDHDEMKKKIRIYASCFLGFGVFSFVTSIVQHYNFAYMGENLTNRVREQLLSKILSFEIGWFDQDQNGTGTICSRLSKDANVVRSLVADRICLLVQATSAVMIAFTMGLIINWRLAIVMIAVQPMLIFCFYMRRVLLKDKSKKITKSQDESIKLTSEAIGNFRTIAAFSSQDKILTMLKKVQLEPRKESNRQSWYAGIGLAAAQGVNISSRAFNIWYGGMLLSRNYLTPIELFEIFIILLSTGRVIAEAGTMTTDIAKGADAVGSLFAILDRCTKIEPDDPNGYKPNEVSGHIEFQNVDFSYPARPNVMIFKGFSLNIEAGKSTALVGQSGSGKSTIINLIARFYDPLGGNVFIDGFELKTYNLRSLRQHIALVSQEPTLFAGTIRENVTYGARDDVEESEIVKASKAANAHEFVSGLKDGYDTCCGDRGVQLSGGQKQRIAIARGMLRNPAILLLDEATSALDSQSEKLVQDALERVMVGRTSVVVAHRLSTIQHCDQIAVLDNGKIVEKGNHSSLLAIGPGGAYHSLVNIQRAPSI